MNKYNYDSVCIEIVKQFEGLYLYSYKCSSDVLTIGFGHTGDDVKINMTITEEQANNLLIKDLNESLYYVNFYTYKYGFNELNQNQINSLVSFTFNCGCGSLAKVLKNSSNTNDIANKMFNYTKNKYGVVLSGLVKRRNVEIALFKKGGDLLFNTLKKGDKNINVSLLQTLLNKFENANLTVDSDFGNKTYAYVVNFQRHNNLKIDGVVGNATWNCLFKKSGLI